MVGANARASMSCAPPGGNGTIRLICLLGYCCASAAVDIKTAMAVTANRFVELFMSASPPEGIHSTRISAKTKPSRSTTSPTLTSIGAENIGPAVTTV